MFFESLQLEFLNLKGDCAGSSETIHIKITHCLKAHVMDHIFSV